MSTVLTRLPATLGVPVVVVQHMPPVFTRLLAERLNEQCQVSVHEAADGMAVEPGHVYIAPGDHHLHVDLVGGRLLLSTNQDPPVHFCRPSVDVMFDSVACHSAAAVLAVVLTGMGSDGASGLLRLRECGWHTVAQDEATCVVYGMPRAAVEMRAATEVLPLPLIGPAIVAKFRARVS